MQGATVYEGVSRRVDTCRSWPRPLEALVFDIQKFSMHDGPGIRTLVFFKGCPLRCVWCSNPEGQSELPELVLNPARCRRLMRCVPACPRDALSLVDDSLCIDRAKCDLCGDCVNACYAGAWRIVGERLNTEHLLREIIKDQPFYRQSSGGVTLGGGEPLLRPEVVAELAAKCHRCGIHVAVETCGHVPWESVETARTGTDLFLYDLKHMNPAVHRGVCGVDNELLLGNLKRLLQGGADVVVRVPVIPGVNDSEENLLATARFVAVHGGERIALLPYHDYGSAKFARLGRSYELKDVTPPSHEALEGMRTLMEACGLAVSVGG